MAQDLTEGNMEQQIRRIERQMYNKITKTLKHFLDKERDLEIFEYKSFILKLNIFNGYFHSAAAFKL